MRAAILALLSAMLAAAESLVLVGGYDPQVRAFALAADGSLRPLATSQVGPNPSFLAVSPDARFAYAVSEVAAGRVVACALDRASGNLRVLGTASSGGTGPAYVAVHPSGRWLLVANYGNGAVAVLPRREDGGIAEPVCVLDAGAHAHMALPSADGRRVVIPCKGADRVVLAAFDQQTGQLTVAGAAATAAGAGPRHLAWSSDASHGILIDELASTVQTLSLPADGPPVLGQAVSILPAGWQGKNTAGGIVIDGARAYASNRGHDSIAILGLDGKAPALVGEIAVGRTPRHLALSPDGVFLLAACQDGGRIDVLRRMPDGGLTAVGSAAAPKPAWVGFATGP